MALAKALKWYMKMQSNSMFANVIFRVFSFHDFGVFLRER
jgi:hypothetical protein